MKELLDLILKNITTHPEAVVIEESDENGVTNYLIKVDPEDMGRVIGKDGKVIRAIRSLAHVIAVRQGKRFRIKLADGEGPAIEDPGSDEPIPVTPEETKAETADLIADTIEVSQIPAKPKKSKTK